ncbi:endonuclease III domain-containing protein, partial [Halobellus sp. EA9]|uniref:endonuclease III domain-containing protein n=1 Tax=Halobellus sp. EA9 TaxID=3421647 RepID=UPI003EBD9531
MPEEPRENISGGDGATAAAFESGDAGTRAEGVVDELGRLYWQKTYGGKDAFESLVRTILSQNTSDVASQPAHDALMERYGSAGETSSDGDHDLAAALADAEQSELAETISSAGLYNQKSEMIVGAAERICEEYGGADGFDAFVTEGDPGEVRDALLDIHGVGPKTADCVLLFAGGRDGVFPVRSWVNDCWSDLSSSWKSQRARVTRPRHPTNDVPSQDVRLGASSREPV